MIIQSRKARIRTLILGAAGRDFHTFNVLYRYDPLTEVVAFTAQQIPDIAGRRYPPDLAGPLYPQGIAIEEEDRLEALIQAHDVKRCVMAYSDVSHEHVMHLASRANAAGATFVLPGARQTMLSTVAPVVAVCAARTGAGKSQTSRAIARILRARGLRVAILRHPMPYGDLSEQRAQRFATRADLERHRVTIEEREEYEPHLAEGNIVYAGVDYEVILARAEADAETDVLLWDGGNNDTPFFVPTLHITVVDPHRAGDEARYYPGETNVRMADVILINKLDTAAAEDVARTERTVHALNPDATIVRADSPIVVDDPERLHGRRVIAVEDGPTVTHGGMPWGAATIAARRLGATLVDPRPFAVGSIADTFAAWPATGPLLPAMGYSERQVRDLEATLRAGAGAGVEAVAIGTPIDLASLIRIELPHTRVRYDLEIRGSPTLEDVLEPVLSLLQPAGPAT